MLSSTPACQQKELSEIGVVLLTFVPKAINVSAPWTVGGDGVQRAHLSTSPVTGPLRSLWQDSGCVCVAAACS